MKFQFPDGYDDTPEMIISRLRVELADVRARWAAERDAMVRDWLSDVGTLTAKLQTAEAQCDAARAEVARLRSVANELAGVVTKVRDGIRNEINGGDNVLTIYLNIMLDKFYALRESNDGNE